MAVGGSTSIAVLPAGQYFIDIGLTDFPVPLLPGPRRTGEENPCGVQQGRIGRRERRAAPLRDDLRLPRGRETLHAAAGSRGVQERDFRPAADAEKDRLGNRGR